MILNRLPFDESDKNALLHKVRLGQYTLPTDIEPDARDLIAKMLVVNPVERIRVGRLTVVVSLQSSNLNPQMEDIKRHPFMRRRGFVESGRATPLPLVSPPDVREMLFPISSIENVDPQVLREVCALWPGVAKEQIIHTLMSNA